jgi:hypothetical protein
VTLPQITVFITALPLQFSLAAFLNRHPSIECLTIFPSMWDLDTPYDRPEVHLPRLKILMGSADDFRIVIRGTSCLEQATVHWRGRTTDVGVENIFGMLSECSIDSLISLCCSHREPWNVTLIETISRRLPDIESLYIHYGKIYGLHTLDMVSSLGSFPFSYLLIVHARKLFRPLRAAYLDSEL